MTVIFHGQINTKYDHHFNFVARYFSRWHLLYLWISKKNQNAVDKARREKIKAAHRIEKPK